MNRWRNHPLLLLVCIVCLLGAQQAANAHFIGHLDAASKTAAFQSSGGDDLPAVEGICATCAAFAALSSAPPSHADSTVAARAVSDLPATALSHFTPAPNAPPYASRAPPAVL